MVKAALVLSLTLILGTSSFLYFYLPPAFHEKVHHELLPQMASGLERTYKELDRNRHESILTSEKFIATVTSVSSFNPANNHLLVKIQSRDQKFEVEAKIYGQVNRNANLLILFNDHIDHATEEKLILKKPLITVSTPLHADLLDPQKRIPYLLAHTQAKFSLIEYYNSWRAPNEEELQIAHLEDLGVAFSISPGQIEDAVSLKSIIHFKTAEFDLAEAKGSYQNFEDVMELGPFSQKGFWENYKGVSETLTEEGNGMPLPFKLMSLLPKIKEIVILPFKFSNTTKASHEAGPISLDIQLSLKDLNLMNFQEAFEATFHVSTPVETFEEQFVEAVAKQLTSMYEREFYPSERKNPKSLGTTQEDIAEQVATSLDIKYDLPPIFKKYLEEVVDGKKRALMLLDKAVEQKLLKREGTAYSVSGAFVKGRFTLNGVEDNYIKFFSLIPREEVVELLLANGYSAVGTP